MASREAQAFRPLLERFGVPSDGVLIVHSGIARLSRRGFRAERIIEALTEHLRHGTLLMPTMTWRTVTPQNPYWDELATPSHTGVLTEIFRTAHATARSIHPTHSVAGCGPAASTLLSRHHVDDTPVSGNSPYGLMRDYDAYVMTLGVGMECATAIHLAEETVNVGLYVRPVEEAELYRLRDRTGAVHVMRARRHRRLDRDFNKFNAPLAARGELEQGLIEDCPYNLVSLRALLRHVFAALIADPFATLSEKAGAEARQSREQAVTAAPS
jgi:aminoglycoside 3-N-acetyltransferase